nr:pitrilysin family protein [Govania unica]
MQIVVIPDHRAPIVTHMVWYKVGSADEPGGRSGLAHFLEHLMFKRTGKLKDGEFSKIVSENGGQHNAFTSYDMTAYYQDVAVDRLPLMMSLEADRMTGLKLKPEDIASERQVIIEERRMRTENNPASLLNEQMMASLFLAHPYHIPVIGWKDEMEALDYKSVIDFYKAHYTPSNAILVVAGDVTGDAVLKLAEKTYGKVRGPEVGPRVRPGEPTPVAARRVILVDERVRQPLMQRLYLAPSYRVGGTPGEAEALDVLGEILGGGSTSRLYRRLVVDKKLATEAAAWNDASAYDLGSFGVYAAPVPGSAATDRDRLQKVETEVDSVIRELLTHGVTADEVARAKSRMIAAEVYSRDSITTLARVFGQGLTTGLTIDQIQSWTDRINAVTPEAVQAAARSILQDQRSVTGLLLPPVPVVANTMAGVKQ